MAESTRVDSIPIDGSTESRLIEAWLRCLQEAFALAKGEHLNRLLMRSVSRYDSRGLDPYSELWGGIHAIQGMLPWLHDELLVTDPITMKAEAKQAAVKEMETRLREATLGELMSNARRNA